VSSEVPQGSIPSARRVIDADRRVHRILRSRFAEALLELGVSFAEVEVMELLHDAHRLHPGEIGRRLLVTRQSAAHLVRQLERAGLVDKWALDGGQVAVRLTPEGRRRTRQSFWALEPTFDCLDALEPGLRLRLVEDLKAREDVLRPRPRPWWREPF
jgi:DNA-binding MarR family transcriptional regulator